MNSLFFSFLCMPINDFILVILPIKSLVNHLVGFLVDPIDNLLVGSPSQLVTIFRRYIGVMDLQSQLFQ